MTKDDIKALAKLEKERRKTVRESQAWELAKVLVRSPMVQMVGSVAVAEVLEEVGILSGKWAGALEGGVITMVGLQALKDYGVIGAGALGLGVGLGALTEGNVDKLIKYGAYAASPPIGALLDITGVT